jgi:hypothetical protein
MGTILRPISVEVAMHSNPKDDGGSIFVIAVLAAMIAGIIVTLAPHAATLAGSDAYGVDFMSTDD